MDKKYNLRLTIFTIIAIFLLCASVTIREFQNDTFYMIKLGEYISEKGLDLQDHFCYIDGLKYTYPHWLFDVIVYFIYNQFNFLGIYVSVVFLFIVLILLIYRIAYKFNYGNHFLAMLVAFFALFGSIPFVTARAQLVSMILFVLEYYFIELLIKEGKVCYILFLGGISLILANIHATIWPMYFILFLPVLAEFFVYQYFEKRIIINKKILLEKVNSIQKIMISMIFGGIMGLFTPSRICYTYIFRIMLGKSQSYISEHAPLVILNEPLFLVLFLLLVGILIFTKTSIKLRELFMLLGLFIMCLVSVRHLSFFYTIGLLVISILCNRCLILNNDTTLDTVGLFMVKKNYIYITLFLLIVLICGYKYNENAKFAFVNGQDYPIKAVNYIKDNYDMNNFRVFNGYNYGAYMLFRGVPVMIDSRADLYLSEFNKGVSIFDDYVDYYYDYDRLYEKYHFDYILVNKKDLLYKILVRDDAFRMDYEDKYFVLFSKVGSD